MHLPSPHVEWDRFLETTLVTYHTPQGLLVVKKDGEIGSSNCHKPKDKCLPRKSEMLHLKVSPCPLQLAKIPVGDDAGSSHQLRVVEVCLFHSNIKTPFCRSPSNSTNLTANDAFSPLSVGRKVLTFGPHINNSINSDASDTLLSNPFGTEHMEFFYLAYRVFVDMISSESITKPPAVAKSGSPSPHKLTCFVAFEVFFFSLLI